MALACWLRTSLDILVLWESRLTMGSTISSIVQSARSFWTWLKVWRWSCDMSILTERSETRIGGWGRWSTAVELPVPPPCTTFFRLLMLIQGWSAWSTLILWHISLLLISKTAQAASRRGCLSNHWRKIWRTISTLSLLVNFLHSSIRRFRSAGADTDRHTSMLSLQALVVE